MGSSLRDIPGAGGGKRRRGGLGKVGGGPAGKPWTPPPKIQKPARSKGASLRFQGPRFEVDRFNLVLIVAFAALFVIGGIWLVRSNRVSVTTGDFGDGDAVRTDGVARLEIEVLIDPADRAEGATVRFEGEDVTGDVETTDTGLVWRPPSTGLEEGSYDLEVSVPKAVFGTETLAMTFGVDDTPPVLDVEPPEGVGIGDELTITGEVDEPVTLEAVGETVEVDEDGTFSITFPTPPAGDAELVATDPAGNVTTELVPIVVAPPSTQAAHVSVDGWNDDGVRDGVLALLDDGDIDTVVLDVKDECGVVTYASDLDLPAQVGAVDDRLDLADAIDTIHEHDGQVMARVVTFRDPMLARWGWANGHQDWVLRDTAGDPWPAYGDGEGCPEATNAPTIVGGFANPDNEAVWDYNASIAEEVADLGADTVLLDDVRRPDGDLTYMSPGLELDYPARLAAFLADARGRVREHGVYLGASVVGGDASLYAQDLAGFAAATDFLAPELVPDPAMPGLSVQAAVEGATEQRGESRTPLVPWLDDGFDAAQVQAQVDGAAAAGACSWILRDPAFTFTPGLRPAC